MGAVRRGAVGVGFELALAALARDLSGADDPDTSQCQRARSMVGWSEERHAF
jgi:hypothetical protein